MNGVFLTWPELAFAAALIVSVYALELLLFFLKSRRTRRVPIDLSIELQQLREQTQSLRSELDIIREQLRSPQTAVAEQAVTETAYSQALKLAQQGLDSSAVAAGCGISRGEAELIVALYRASLRP
ncbi:MAG: DUF2802 domain-containing protein [Burkholderiales bacterium]|nr:DUF2802 domain-containing protein [Burkholderiales bacterium]